MNTEQIAQIVHTAVNTFRLTIGEEDLGTWENLDEDRKQLTRNAVTRTVEYPNISPEDQHEIWAKEKREQGWTYGAEKCPKNLTHPSLIPYEQLSENEKIKDKLVTNTIKAFL